MTTIIGRERESTELERALLKGRTQGVATVLRVTGLSGIGKSTILGRLADRAREQRYLVVPIECHRIQANTPMVTIRRAVATTLEALGEEQERYSAGLDISGEVASDALLNRLIEGILVDRAVLFVIDDAQWMDGESGIVFDRLLQAFCDLPVAVAIAERIGGGEAPLATAPAASVALDRLSDAEAATLVRSIHPAVSPTILHAIIDRCAGHPIDIQALSESARDSSITNIEELSTSLDGIVARFVRSLPGDQREFLQVCALIAEPIEYTLLAYLFTDEARLVDLVQQATLRYLIRDGRGLRFVHSAIGESVRRTIPIEVPYRRRIIGALAKQDQNLENLQRLIEQALACGDKPLARTTLLTLAQEATKLGAFGAASKAYERAIELEPPSADQFVSLYIDYVTSLTALGRSHDAHTVAEQALRGAEALGIREGLGPLASRVILSLAASNELALAGETYASFLGKYTTNDDLAELYSAQLYVESQNVNVAAFEALSEKIRQLDSNPSAVIAVRLHLFEVMLRLRSGSPASARQKLDDATAFARASAPFALPIIDQARMIVELHQHGLRSIRQSLGDLRARDAGGYRRFRTLDYFAALDYVATGEWSEAQRLIADALIQQVDPLDARRLLGLEMLMAALARRTSPLEGLARRESERLAAESKQSIVTVAPPLAAAIAATDASTARSITHAALQHMATPRETLSFTLPYAFVLTAETLEDKALLTRLGTTSTYWDDTTPWNRAHVDLARDAALALTGEKSARKRLTATGAAFDELGAPLFGAIARTRAGSSTETDTVLLQRCGIIESPKSDDFGLSRREREVVALVSQGKTNREIAQTLFLSERTVEAHLSNVFNKTGASSRTQLARKFLENATPVA